VSLEERVAIVVSKIRAAAQRRARDPHDITLVAVSKTQPIEQLQSYAGIAAREGVPVVFGENYLQEIKEKHPRLPEGSELHMIGPLQSNKVRDSVLLCDVIESVHASKTIDLLAKEAARISKIQRMLLQVNIGRDDNKSGFTPEAIPEAIATCQHLSAHLQLEGLMTILPYDEDPEASRPHFKAMADLRAHLSAQGLDAAFHKQTIRLSMGMSDDFEIAIEEGADIVRVGTALFGERSYSS
jgi:pyridoxal phosphate enzyme (YggS family)